MKHKLESRLPGEISITSDMQRVPERKLLLLYIYFWHQTNGRKQRRTKESLDESERGSKKAGLKLNIQKTEIMAPGSITSWQIDGETVETDRLYFLELQITVDGDYSHEIKRCLLLGRKALKNLVYKNQKYHFADRGPYSQSYDFSSSHVRMWDLDHK